ncbi:phosphoadenosine phosphosulfate reductase family protein [Achromobacter xylosoxidans]
MTTTATIGQGQPLAHQAILDLRIPHQQDASVEEKEASAIAAIYGLFEQGRPVAVSFSGGKDSSVLMHLVLQAAIRAHGAGLAPHVVVVSSDTGVENPEVALLLRREHAKIRAALTAAGVKHEVVLTQPSLASSWAVRILGGSKLPSFPGSSHDCAVDFKVAPIASARAAVFKDLGRENTVTVIGTRFDESEQRGRAMTARGELSERPYRNEAGEWVMSPIAFWSTDDVWEQIGLIRAGIVSSYSDFEDTFRLYADAGGTSCAVVSDAITEGAKKARGGCGARFGCFVCQAVSNDTSLETMIEADPEYAYMRGLSKLRNLIARTRFDYSRRYWVQRSIDSDGAVKLQPDCYSPAFLLDLFRYCASLDYQEEQAARRGRHSVRYRLLSPEAVVAIDALWSLNGFHAPHTALLEWLAIMDGRALYSIEDADKVPEAPRKPLPPAVPYQAGATWDGAELGLFSGTRDVAQALAESPVRETKDGRHVLALDTEPRMQVDMESFYMALDFEWDAILERHRAPRGRSDWTAGYRFWTSYGTLSLAPAQLSEHDHALRRTAWRAEHGFIGEEGNRRAQKLAVPAQESEQMAQAA